MARAVRRPRQFRDRKPWQSRRSIRIVVWDGTGRYQLVDGRDPLTIAVRGDIHTRPWSVAQRIFDQLGWAAAILRIAGDNVVEVELIGESPPTRRWRWRAAAMMPPLHQRPSWQRPGWMTRSVAELQTGLSRLGLQIVGPPVQSRHTALTAMVTMPTSNGLVWLKETHPLFAHEPVVISWLAAAMPRCVPRVLLDNGGWWATAEFPHPASRPAESHLAALARLQIAALERGSLGAIGIPTRSPPEIAEEIAGIVEWPRAADVGTRGRLRQLMPRLMEICEQAASSPIPASVVHGDFHRGNTRWTARGWLIYDWTDACLSHPFVDLAHTIWDDDIRQRNRQINQFLDEWSKVVSAPVIHSAVAAAPTISAAFQTASYARIVRAVDSEGSLEPTMLQVRSRLNLWTQRLVHALETDRAFGS